MSGNVQLTGTLICASEAECDIVRQYLPEHIRLTREEPGCISFEVTPSDDPMIWRVEELFVDQVAFYAHQARTKASAWAEKTASIRRVYRITAADRS